MYDEIIPELSTFSAALQTNADLSVAQIYYDYQNSLRKTYSTSLIAFFAFSNFCAINSTAGP